MVRFLVALALVSTGCSVVLQKKPSSSGGVASTTECSTTNAYWIADTVIAGLAAGAAISATPALDGNPDAKNITIGVGILTAIVYFASAHNGYKWRRECAVNRESMPVAAR